jgi:hypothetical protein
MLVSFLVGMTFFFIQWKNVCCDAIQYVEFAGSYFDSGFFTAITGSDRRTIGYISLLALLKLITGGLTGVDFDFVAFVLQWAFYNWAALQLARELSLKTGYNFKIFFLILISNVVFIPYLNLTLTEAVYITLFVWWLFFISKSNILFSSKPLKLHSFILASLTAGFALIVRPAALWIVVAQAMLIGFLLFRTELKQNRWVKGIVLSVAASVTCLLFFPLLQAFHNLIVFDHFTALPHFNLAQYQYSLGVENIKYDTFISASGRGYGVFYKNIFFDGGLAELSWYFGNPVAAIKTFGLKLIALFDFQYLFPYIVNQDPWHGILTRLYGATALFFGITGMLFFQRKTKNIFLSFAVLTLFILWLGTAVLSTVEVRFGLPMVTYFGLLSLLPLEYFYKSAMRTKIVFGSCYIIFISVFCFLANFIAEQRVVVQ